MASPASRNTCWKTASEVPDERPRTDAAIAVRTASSAASLRVRCPFPDDVAHIDLLRHQSKLKETISNRLLICRDLVCDWGDSETRAVYCLL